eukprot:scaffold98_cov64-Phaeocystis_antarctica.AAC.6
MTAGPVHCDSAAPQAPPPRALPPRVLPPRALPPRELPPSPRLRRAQWRRQNLAGAWARRAPLAARRTAPAAAPRPVRGMAARRCRAG